MKRKRKRAEEEEDNTESGVGGDGELVVSRAVRDCYLDHGPTGGSGASAGTTGAGVGIVSHLDQHPAGPHLPIDLVALWAHR